MSSKIHSMPKGRRCQHQWVRNQFSLWFLIKCQRTRIQGCQEVYSWVLAYLGICGVRECQIGILQWFLTKCWVVWNIIQHQEVYSRVLAYLGVCGVGECQMGIPRQFLTKCWVVWNIILRQEVYSWVGSVKCYSTASFHKVSNSLKYFMMPRSFLLAPGVTLHMQCRGVSSVILWHLFTKCQIVWNILRCWEVFCRLLALPCICSATLYFINLLWSVNMSEYGYAEFVHVHVFNQTTNIDSNKTKKKPHKFTHNKFICKLNIFIWSGKFLSLPMFREKLHVNFQYTLHLHFC